MNDTRKPISPRNRLEAIPPDTKKKVMDIWDKVIHEPMNDTQTEIAALESQLTGDMMRDMEIREKIHKLKMKQTGTTCSIDNPECENCGS